MNGTAGVPTLKPGTAYHGAESSAGDRNVSPLFARKSNATKFTLTNSRVAQRPSHLCSSE
jgi:hypothetical protein